ncbi:MAG: Hpt domain-containing protein [Burkholderiales bacterium]
MASLAEFDVGPLTWVKGEIDQALARSLAALRAYATNPGDAAQLRYCQTHFHQAHGALQIVGLDGAAKFTEELEGLIADLGRGLQHEGLAIAERGYAAITTYLEQLLAGQPNQPLKLFAVYREVVVYRGRAEPDPVDLYFPDLTGRAPKRQQEPRPLSSEERSSLLREEQTRFQRGLLRWLRRDQAGARDMAQAVRQIEAVEMVPGLRAFWWAAHALVDAVSNGHLEHDPAIGRLANRIERQMKRLADSGGNVAERLMREVLFFVARAQPATAPLREVQYAFGLTGSVPEKFELVTENMAHLPRLRAMREVVGNAKTAWTRYASGHTPTVAPFCEYAVMLRDRSAGLGRWELSRLAEEMVAIADGLIEVSGPIDEALALEVATGLLLFEDAVEKFNTLPAEFARQCQAMIARLRAYRGEGLPADATGTRAPILQDIARRAQERMAIAQLVAEIQTNLRAVETGLDAFFRDPVERSGLAALEKPVIEVVGAFRILNETRAVEALEEAGGFIKRFREPGYRAREFDFEYVAGVLSGLGFYADALQHGRADFDAAMQPIRNRRAELELEEGAQPASAVSIEQQLAGSQRAAAELLAAWRASPQAMARRDELRQRVEAIQRDAGLVADGELERRAIAALALLDRPNVTAEQTDLAAAIGALQPRPTPAAKPTAETEALAEASREVLDAELLDIYLQEATEVLASVHEHLERARRNPGAPDVLVPIRRGFHTLKGSGRMVGLTRLADAAWSIEKLLNGWLEAEHPPTEDLLRIVAAAERYFSDAVVRLKQDEPLPDESSLVNMAGTVRVDEPAIEIGERRISSALYNIFLAEAKSHLETMRTAQNALAASGLIADDYRRAAHTLAGISGTVNLLGLRELGLAIESAIDRVEQPVNEEARQRFAEAFNTIESMIRAVAARRTPERPIRLLAHLAELRSQRPPTSSSIMRAAVSPPLVTPRLPNPPVTPPRVVSPPIALIAPTAPISAALPVAPAVAPAKPVASTAARSMVPGELDDDLDADLIPVFIEEGQELLPAVGTALRDWRDHSSNTAAGQALQRLLHTLKGSARMAGAMTIGQALHSMETRAEGALASPTLPANLFDELEAEYDRVGTMFDDLRAPRAAGEASASESAVDPLGVSQVMLVPGAADGDRVAVMRVRAEMIDRLVNEAGEVSIARSRIEGEMRVLKSALSELTENVSRLRNQLREIEIQAETQIQSRLIHSKDDLPFDPLEFDRFTRFQELTRMMAESVNDVATVQSNISRSIDETETALSVQARLSRDLQQDLLRVRMMPFSSISERLYRIVRQAANESGKRAVLDIRNGEIELDRSVLERITAPFEHMLRNAVVHGLESPAARRERGKSEVGEIRIEARQEGNEVRILVADDGAGLDFARIRERALAQGLMTGADERPEAELAEMIFLPGFTTATEITALAGRGVGMDVVKSEIASLGGRVEVMSESHRGTQFAIALPLTLAVTQAVLVSAAGAKYVIPAVMIEQVRQVKPDELGGMYDLRVATWQGRRSPFYYLPRLFGDTKTNPDRRAAAASVIFVRSGSNTVAIHIDEMLGNHEIVVKNMGPLIARIAGITGATVLGSGEIVLIINPVLLAQREVLAAASSIVPAFQPASTEPVRPTVMIVDDSLTVRKITGRLLQREGYNVLTARDGVDALEQLEDGVPEVMLVDIEMPRMDGFDLTRTIRADDRMKHVPIIMITSRTAEKHRNYAREIGVNIYLGKPYRDDELLLHVANFVKAAKERVARSS